MNNPEDIPVIQRTAPTEQASGSKTKSGRVRPGLWIGAGTVLLAGFCAAVFFAGGAKTEPSAVKVARVSTSALGLPGTVMGHFRYPEAKRSELVSVGSYRDTGRTVRLRQSAAAHYGEMVRAARADGVWLVPISGFRSERHQESLYTRQLGRTGTVSTATLVSAPPGYSEHHTGYAVDIGDGTQPGTDTQFSFERTAAFRWLKTHGGRYGFELSFPPDNTQQVSYEPWHWRFIGDRRAVETFYKVRSAT